LDKRSLENAGNRRKCLFEGVYSKCDWSGTLRLSGLGCAGGGFLVCGRCDGGSEICKCGTDKVRGLKWMAAAIGYSWFNRDGLLEDLGEVANLFHGRFLFRQMRRLCPIISDVVREVVLGGSAVDSRAQAHDLWSLRIGQGIAECGRIW